MSTEKRLILAVLLMMAVVFGVNVLFPPPQPPQGTRAPDTAAARRPEQEEPAGRPQPATPRETEQPQRRAERAAEVPEVPLTRPEGVEAKTPGPEDTVWVTGPLFRYGFSDRGGRLVSAEMRDYESLAPETRGQPVQLVPPEVDGFFTHRWLVGDDTLDLSRARFEISPAGGLTLREGGEPRDLTLRYDHPRSSFSLEVVYHFRPNAHVFQMEGRVTGVPATGWWVLGLGPGLLSNEWDPQQDYSDNLSFVAKGPDGVKSQKVGDVEPGERRSLDGPFDWVAIRTKYFLSAVVLPEAQASERRFAGLRVTGLPEPHRARGLASFPLGRDGTFGYRIYLGPQDYTRLKRVGYELEQVSPYGYKWLQPVIRPLAGAITTLLVWLHQTLSVGYGWILILFGIGIRVILFPLYQKSMRSQMATMRVQPLMKEIQNKYKDDPQRLQQEMIKLYREHKINPLGGCLPMLLPFPILIALFFVFRDTIEFRGVPFLWLPDLSRPDPYYIIPVLMGLSVFLLQWIGQRSMSQSNPQMKVMMYAMPVILTVVFLNFASGLNLYYATMNLASLPQQLYLAKERRAAAEQQPRPAGAKS